MTRFRTIGVILLIAAAALLWLPGAEAATDGSATSTLQIRGAWVTSWAPGMLTSSQVDATVAAAKKAGLNALFVQVRKNADAYYESSMEPRGQGIAPDFDPLAYIIRKAHAEGIQVHAWVVLFRAWTAKDPPSDPKNLIKMHPDWINLSDDGKNRAGEGIYIDPGIPEVREHVVSVLEDIVRRYPVDGIHYDYVRYPGSQWGYSARALSLYSAFAGTNAKPSPKDPKWLQWRRDQVNELVKTAHDRLKAIKPNIVISASTVSWGDCPNDFCDASCYRYLCQDWKLWMSSGWLDSDCPMNYKPERHPGSAREFRDWLVGFKKWNGGKQVYVGINLTDNSTEDVLRQIDAVKKAGHEGFVIFSFNESAKREALVQKLAAVLR